MGPSDLRPTIKIVDPLTDPDWDAKVATFPEATPFHTAAWARVIHETYGFEPCYFVGFDASGIQAIQPMIEASTWATRRRGIALPFTDECALLARDPSVEAGMRAAVIGHARRRKWHYVEYRDHTTAVGDSSPSRFVRHVLDLRPDAAVLLQQLDSSNRRAIRKAEKEGVTVTIAHDVGAMREFYRLQELTRRRHGIPPQPWTFFAGIQRHMLGEGRGFIALGRVCDLVVAATVFFTFGRWAIYKFGASDESFQKARPNNAVMWNSILRARELGAESLHFGRSSTHQVGLRAFKLGWGAAESPLEYGLIDPKTANPIIQAPSTPIYERVAPITRMLPRRVSRWLGSALYRHIA